MCGLPLTPSHSHLFRSISKSAPRIRPDEVEPNDPVLRTLNAESKARLEQQLASGEINEDDLNSDGDISNHLDTDSHSDESDAERIPPSAGRRKGPGDQKTPVSGREISDEDGDEEDE